jgi:hypothetical protein
MSFDPHDRFKLRLDSPSESGLFFGRLLANEPFVPLQQLFVLAKQTARRQRLKVARNAGDMFCKISRSARLNPVFLSSSGCKFLHLDDEQ